MSGKKPPNAKYNGYASYPLIVGKNHVILADSGSNQPRNWQVFLQLDWHRRSFFESLILLDEQEVDEEGHVPLYWNLWTKGKWFGISGPFKQMFLRKIRIFPEDTIEFLTELSIAIDSTYFIGTFNSNIGTLVTLLRSCKASSSNPRLSGYYNYFRSYGDDTVKWTIR